MNTSGNDKDKEADVQALLEFMSVNAVNKIDRLPAIDLKFPRFVYVPANDDFVRVEGVNCECMNCGNLWTIKLEQCRVSVANQFLVYCEECYILTSEQLGWPIARNLANIKNI